MQRSRRKNDQLDIKCYTHDQTPRARDHYLSVQLERLPGIVRKE